MSATANSTVANSTVANSTVANSTVASGTAADSAAADSAAAGGGGAAAPDVVLRVSGLSVHFPVRRGVLQRRVGTVRAVDGVSFEVQRGTTLGLVGESGCGKSTTARAVLRLVEPTAGRIEICGEDVTALSQRAMRRVRPRVQMVFQDPHASLNPRMTVFDAVAEPLRVHGRVKDTRQATSEVASLLEKVGLGPAYMRRYPHELSGGQRQRVGIARAIALRPDVLILDEPVSALDVSIQAQIVNLLAELQASLGLSYVFVAHDLAVVRHLSTQVAVMYLGRIVERASTEELFARPLHPYTQALLSAVPVPDPAVERARKRLPVLGEVPSAQSPPPGCAFHPRCPAAMPRCKTDVPELAPRAAGDALAGAAGGAMHTDRDQNDAKAGRAGNGRAAEHAVACHLSTEEAEKAGAAVRLLTA